MTEKLNLILYVEDTDLCIETNINFKPESKDLTADIWLDQDGPYAKRLHWFKGQDALTEAVMWLAEYLKQPVAQRLLAIQKAEIWS